MKALRSIPALGAFFVVIALVVAGCGGSDIPGNSVATVAGNPISSKAFNHWMYVDAKGQAAQSPGQPVIVPNDPPDFSKCVSTVRKQIPQLKKTATKTLKADCSQLFHSLSSQVMDFLIKAYWYQAQAHKLGIKVTNAQIQKALKKAKQGQFKTNAQYQAFLKESGQTAQDILYRVRVNQVFTKLLKRHPTKVTDADVASYYKQHKSQFGAPQRRDMRIVLAKNSAQASAAKSALQSGQSWSAVAKKYSTDPTTKDKGGLLKNVTAGQQDQALSKAAFAAPANKLEGPVKGQFGYYVLEVTKVSKATQQSLSQARAQIKQMLTQQKQTAAQTAVDNAAKKNWLSDTHCRKTYAMADCSGYKPPKTSTTSAPPSSAPPSSSSSSASSSTTTSSHSKSK